jgi:ketosteroid isomerase-like protein
VSDDQAQIRALLADVTAGYRARDAGQIVASYVPDIVMYSLATPLRSRRGDLLDIGGGRKVDLTTAEGVQVWLDGFGDAPFDYEIRDLEVEAGGDVAYAHGLARMGPEGVFSMWLRVTFGLRKTEGRWQIAHLHGSVPFYMDQTFKAAVDLQP